MIQFLIGMLYMMLCLSAQSNFISEEILGKTKSELEQTLSHYIQESTARQNVKIYLVVQPGPSKILVHLQPRYQRELLFRFHLEYRDNQYIVSGLLATDLLRSQIELVLFENLGKNILFNWKIGPLGYAITKSSYANLYMESVVEEGDNLASQVLYGTPLILWEKDSSSDLYRVQSMNDRYIGWIESAHIAVLSKMEWEKWLQFPKVYPNIKVFTSERYFPVGSTLAWKDGEVHFWDEKKTGDEIAIISLEKTHYQQPNFVPVKKDILETAQRFLPMADLSGIQYVWGGANIPDLDCSGFVQLVYRLNQILLPRDSDQQYQFSRKVSMDNLEPADLLFFSRHGRHPTHVGIYLGDDRYIHCSPVEPNGVKINLLHGTTEYESMLYSIYYGAGRILEKK